MRYVELHLHANHSFLDGASPPEEMVARAAELGMDALAISDHQGLYGAVKFHTACREHGIKMFSTSSSSLTRTTAYP